MRSSDNTKVSMEMVLRSIRFGPRHVLLILYSDLIYGTACASQMVPTFSLDALSEKFGDGIYLPGVMIAQAVARVLGSLFVTPIADVYGRRNSMFCCIVLATLFNCLGIVSPDYPVYILLRGLTMVCMSPSLNMASIYVAEMCHPKHRSLMAMLMQATGSVMMLYAVVLQIFLPGASIWRTLPALVFAPLIFVLCLVVVFVFYETPYYLLYDQKDNRKAWDVLLKLARPKTEAELLKSVGINSFEQLSTSPAADTGENDTARAPAATHLAEEAETLASPSSLAHEEFTSVEMVEAIEEDYGKGVLDAGDQAPLTVGLQRPKRSAIQHIRANLRTMVGEWKILLLNPRYRVSVYEVAGLWFLNDFSHWGLSSFCTLFFASLDLNVTTVLLSMYGFEILAHITMCGVMQQFGRIAAMKYGFLVSAASAFAVALVVGLNVSHRGLLTFLSCVMYVAGAMQWGPVYSYSAEGFPPALRGSAMGLFSAVGGLSSCITIYIGGINKGGPGRWITPLVWGGVRLAACSICFLLKTEVKDNDIVK